MGEKPTEVDADGFVLLAPGHWRMSTMQERIQWAIWKGKQDRAKWQANLRGCFVPRGNLR